MTQVLSVSATTAAIAMDAVKSPQRVSTAAAARESKRIADRQMKRAVADGPNEPINIIQSTEVALDLLTLGFKQPQASLQQANKSYRETGR